MKPFIDLAVNKGVKRLVLLSGATLQKGDLAMGKVHEYLVSEEMKAKGVEAVILRPSYFLGGFFPAHKHKSYLIDCNRKLYYRPFVHYQAI